MKEDGNCFISSIRGVEGIISLTYGNVFTFKELLRKVSNLNSGSFSVSLVGHSTCNINYSH